MSVEALGQLGYGEEAASVLLEIIRDPAQDEDTQRLAATVFVGLSPPGAVAELAADEKALPDARAVATAYLFLPVTSPGSWLWRVMRTRVTISAAMLLGSCSNWKL